MAARQAVLGMDQGGFFYGTTKVFTGVSFMLDDARTALVGETAPASRHCSSASQASWSSTGAA